jgi:hypothetical protein
MTTNSYNASGGFLGQNLLQSNQPGFVQIFSAKTDAVLPFRRFSLKAGLKYARVSNDNEFRFDALGPDGFVEVPSLSNHFKYQENIGAIYASASKKFNKTNLEMGLRVEHTDADGYTLKDDIANSWQYTRLFPSLALEHTLNERNKVDLVLSRRINRPSYTDLNPVRWYNDQYFLYSGNPGLVPELAWVYALNYSFDKYIFTISYNQSVNFIDRRLVVEEEGKAIRSMSDNFGRRNRFDFTASVPLQPLKFWDIQFFGDLSFTSYPVSGLSGESQLSLLSLTASLQQDFSLPEGFKFNLAGYLYTSELSGIYQTRTTGSIDIGIKKSLLNKKLSMQLSLSDVFNTDRFVAYSRTDITDYHYNDKQYTRVLGLSFKYHFGGEVKKATTRKTEEQQRL